MSPETVITFPRGQNRKRTANRSRQRIGVGGGLGGEKKGNSPREENSGKIEEKADLTLNLWGG